MESYNNAFRLRVANTGKHWMSVFLVALFQQLGNHADLAIEPGHDRRRVKAMLKPDCTMATTYEEFQRAWEDHTEKYGDPLFDGRYHYVLLDNKAKWAHLIVYEEDTIQDIGFYVLRDEAPMLQYLRVTLGQTLQGLATEALARIDIKGTIIKWISMAMPVTARLNILWQSNKATFMTIAKEIMADSRWSQINVTGHAPTNEPTDLLTEARYQAKLAGKDWDDLTPEIPEPVTREEKEDVAWYNDMAGETRSVTLGYQYSGGMWQEALSSKRVKMSQEDVAKELFRAVLQARAGGGVIEHLTSKGKVKRAFKFNLREQWCLHDLERRMDVRLEDNCLLC